MMRSLARAFAARPDAGRLLENAVYLELRRRGGDICWMRTRSGFEVDFAVQTGGDTTLIQVCEDVSDPATRARELRALEEAMQELEVDRATIVTRLDEETLKTRSGSIAILPAWRWLLDR